ncbi:hypothetical protein [Mycobacteroides abscessus]|uniref:hypothetical protein n=1 Tax=Mycobacteroides abscessus TaxID=36809 RepID=UPI001F28F2D7|nr:hypothetical protein [Mycobacteroides abscessus]
MANIRYETALFRAENVTGAREAILISNALTRHPKKRDVLRSSLNLNSQRLTVCVHGRFDTVLEMLSVYCAACQEEIANLARHETNIDCSHATVGMKYQIKLSDKARTLPHQKRAYSVELIQYRVNEIDMTATSSVGASSSDADQAALDANYRWMMDTSIKFFEMGLRSY